jgi:hypothetical protein
MKLLVEAAEQRTTQVRICVILGGAPCDRPDSHDPRFRDVIKGAGARA